jgi:hypothetical protein
VALYQDKKLVEAAGAPPQTLQPGVLYAERYDMPKARTIVFLLAAATSLAPNKGALAETQPCRSIEYERSVYTICEVDLRKHTVRLYWKRSDGTPYAYLSALPRALEGESGRLLFATNAGMFDPALQPMGLYVEQGRELVHVNTVSGYGNFHMKPNGVFYISLDRAAVAETRAFLKQRPHADLATQSWADAGDKWALASPFRREQHVAQSAQRCGRTRGWQSDIRDLSGRGVV